VRERLFESGFTTKETGHGLGMASVREFAAAFIPKPFGGNELALQVRRLVDVAAQN
jgi:C4-dicarboxylate-specific signal transduction histidine kinase